MKKEELIREIDPAKEPELYRFLKGIPDDEQVTLASVRRVIDAGAGSFTETELLFLFLENIFQRMTGENREW